MHRPFLLPFVCALSLAACGPALDPAMAGTWVGTTSYAFSGLSTIDVSGASVVTTLAGGDELRVLGTCPTGSGFITATGAGGHATWSGNLVCPAVDLLGCSAVTISYSSGTLDLRPGGVLDIVAHGSGSGCASTRSLLVTFAGTRR